MSQFAMNDVENTSLPPRSGAAFLLNAEERRQMQALLRSLLAELDRICRKEGLNYVLMFDTLWGALCGRALRADADSVALALPRADYERLLELLDGPVLHPRYYLEKPGGEEGSLRCAARLCCKNSLLVRSSFAPLGGAESPLALYLYPLDTVATADDLQSRRLQRICAWNEALLRRANRQPAVSADQGSAAYYQSALAPLALAPAEIFAKSLLPSSWALRLRERLMRGGRHSRGDVLVIYSAMDGLLPACYFEKTQVFPSSGILLGKKSYASPARAHELLTALYGDYRSAERQSPPRAPLYESFFIDAPYWADILYAEHPEDVL